MEKVTKTVKRIKERNPYVTEMRFRKSGGHFDKRRQAAKMACRTSSGWDN